MFFPFNYIKLLFLILIGMDIIWHLIACLLYMLMLYLSKSAPNIFSLVKFALEFAVHAVVVSY